MKDDETDRLTAAIVRRRRQRREELGLSVNKVAEMAGINHAALLRLEEGSRTPMLRTALKLTKALDFPLSELLAELGH